MTLPALAKKLRVPKGQLRQKAELLSLQVAGVLDGSTEAILRRIYRWKNRDVAHLPSVIRDSIGPVEADVLLRYVLTINGETYVQLPSTSSVPLTADGAELSPRSSPSGVLESNDLAQALQQLSASVQGRSLAEDIDLDDTASLALAELRERAAEHTDRLDQAQEVANRLAQDLDSLRSHLTFLEVTMIEQRAFFLEYVERLDALSASLTHRLDSDIPQLSHSHFRLRYIRGFARRSPATRPSGRPRRPRHRAGSGADQAVHACQAHRPGVVSGVFPSASRLAA